MNRTSLLSLLATVVVFGAMAGNASAQQPPVFTPVAGVWNAPPAPGRNGISMTFFKAQGFNNAGNAFGKGITNGAGFDYIFKQTSPGKGRMLLTLQNGQVEVFVTFQGPNRMLLQFGGETIPFDRYN